MSSLIERLLGRKEPSSAEIAKERLKLVLVTDRSEITPEQLRTMQAEILDVIRKYVPLDDMALEIKVEQRERQTYLVADIPLRRENTYQPPSEPAAAAAAEADAPGQPAESLGVAATSDAGEDAGAGDNY